MDKFPKKADLLAELKGFGSVYLDNVRTNFSDRDREATDNFTINQLEQDEKLRKLGGHVISGMIAVPARLPHIRAMNAPVFRWNGSLYEPVVHAANNQLLNSSDCFPPSLTTLAMDYVEQGYGDGEEIYDKFVQKVGALFYNEATPRDFQMDASEHGVKLHFADHTKSPIAEYGHVANGKLLYEIISEGGLPAFDVHDIAHHASQMSVYGDFYKWLTSHATEEIMQATPEHQRKRRLLRTVLLTSLEHSVVESEQGAQSFGCLNWQAPRKSILSAGVSKRDEFKVNEYVFGAQDINLWSAVRAIASMYREQLEAEELLGTKLDWMGAMGYGMDQELLARIRPFQGYDYSDLTFDSARKAKLQVPTTPEELFGNCKRLVEREFNDSVGTV